MHTITARTRVVGFHRWPDAPDHLSYLRELHRHEFGFAVEAAVGHGDRAVEFHELRAVMDREMPNLADDVKYHPNGAGGHPAGLVFGCRSCEHLAEGMGGRLEGLGYTVLKVTVSEDGENDGAWIPAWLEPALPPRQQPEPATTLIPSQADVEATASLPAVARRGRPVVPPTGYTS